MKYFLGCHQEGNLCYLVAISSQSGLIDLTTLQEWFVEKKLAIEEGFSSNYPKKISPESEIIKSLTSHELICEVNASALLNSLHLPHKTISSEEFLTSLSKHEIPYSSHGYYKAMSLIRIFLKSLDK